MQKVLARRFNEYIFLSSQTTGKDGRRVFINPDLLGPYLEFVEEDKFSGQQSLQKMIGLKNSAAGLTSQSNQNDAHQHRLDCGSVLVTYSVVQGGSPDSYGEGVYISGLQQSLNRGQGKPAGFYAVSSNQSQWVTQSTNSKSLSTTIGAVAASFDRENNLYDLEMTGEATGGYLEKNAKGSELGNAFALYYSPTFIIDNIGTWSTPEQKIASGNAGPEELAQILVNTQKQYWAETDQIHHWFIFGHGAKLLEKALRIVEQSGTNSLSHHAFSFIEPRASLGGILQKIGKLGAKFDKLLSLTSGGAKFFQASSLDAARSGFQLHDKSWTTLEQNLAPASKLLSQVDGVIARIAENPQRIGEFSSKNFVDLVESLKTSLNWKN